jgi:hypothetical protein
MYVLSTPAPIGIRKLEARSVRRLPGRTRRLAGGSGGQMFFSSALKSCAQYLPMKAIAPSPADHDLSSGLVQVQPRRPSALRPRVFPIRAKWHCDDMERTRVAETLRLLANRTRGQKATTSRRNHSSCPPGIRCLAESSSVIHYTLARSLPATADVLRPHPTTRSVPVNPCEPQPASPLLAVPHQLTCPVHCSFGSSLPLIYTSCFRPDAHFAHPSAPQPPPSTSLLCIPRSHQSRTPKPNPPISSSSHEHHSKVLLGPGRGGIPITIGCAGCFDYFCFHLEAQANAPPPPQSIGDPLFSPSFTCRAYRDFFVVQREFALVRRCWRAGHLRALAFKYTNIIILRFVSLFAVLACDLSPSSC